MIRRRAWTLGLLSVVVAVLSVSTAPACAGFNGCDEEGRIECDGDDAVRLCQRSCEMRGTPDERCSGDFSWETLECDSGRTCASDPQGRRGCVVPGTRSCAVEPLPWRGDFPRKVNVDGSGVAELVVFEGQRVSVDFGGGKVVVSELTDRPSRWPVVGDFDGDGRVDFAWLDVARRPVVALGDGLGSFRVAPGPTEIVLEGSLLAASDVDGDGKSDLVVSTGRGVAFVAFTREEGRFTRGPETRLREEEVLRPDAPPPYFEVYAAADFDGDGLVDLLLQNGALVVGRRDGRFEPHGVLPRSSPMLSSGQTAAGDVDGDGDLDIVTTDYLDSRLVAGVFLNDGRGGFQRVSACATDPRAPGCVVLGEKEDLLGLLDIDGDGRADLVASDWVRSLGASPHTLHVRLGRGDGNFEDKGSFFVPAEPRSLAVHDGRLVVGNALERVMFAVPRSCW